MLQIPMPPVYRQIHDSYDRIPEILSYYYHSDEAMFSDTVFVRLFHVTESLDLQVTSIPVIYIV